MADNNNNNNNNGDDGQKKGQTKGKGKPAGGSGAQGSQQHQAGQGGSDSSQSVSRGRSSHGRVIPAFSGVNSFPGTAVVPEGQLPFEVTRDRLGRITDAGFVNAAGGPNTNAMSLAGAFGLSPVVAGTADKGNKRPLEDAERYLDLKEGEAVNFLMWKTDPKRLRRTAPGCKRSRPSLAGFYDPVSTRADFERLAAEQAARPAVIAPPPPPPPTGPAADSSRGQGRGQGRGRGRGRGRGGRGSGRVGRDEPVVRKCAGCGSNTHDLMRCLKAGPDGLMAGCPKCNTMEHGVAQCPRLTTDEQKKRLLVEGRGNMPAFQDVMSWASIAQTAVANGSKAPKRFPWTPAFTKSLAGDIPQIQAELDRLGFSPVGGCKLPVDPETRDWSAVQTTCSRPAADSLVSTAEQEAAARALVAENFRKRKEAEAAAAHAEKIFSTLIGDEEEVDGMPMDVEMGETGDKGEEPAEVEDEMEIDWNADIQAKKAEEDATKRAQEEEAKRAQDEADKAKEEAELNAQQVQEAELAQAEADKKAKEEAELEAQQLREAEKKAEEEWAQAQKDAAKKAKEEKAARKAAKKKASQEARKEKAAKEPEVEVKVEADDEDIDLSSMFTDQLGFKETEDGYMEEIDIE